MHCVILYYTIFCKWIIWNNQVTTITHHKEENEKEEGEWGRKVGGHKEEKNPKGNCCPIYKEEGEREKKERKRKRCYLFPNGIEHNKIMSHLEIKSDYTIYICVIV